MTEGHLKCLSPQLSRPVPVKLSKRTAKFRAKEAAGGARARRSTPKKRSRGKAVIFRLTYAQQLRSPMNDTPAGRD